jgi:hypothetical protein
MASWRGTAPDHDQLCASLLHETHVDAIITPQHIAGDVQSPMRSMQRGMHLSHASQSNDWLLAAGGLMGFDIGKRVCTMLHTLTEPCNH